MSSDWKESANKRRDFKAIKSDGDKIKNKKKDTKRWCLGKEGREHTAICMTVSEAKPGSIEVMGAVVDNSRHLVCTTCGKHIEVYYGLENEKKPDWVNK